MRILLAFLALGLSTVYADEATFLTRVRQLSFEGRRAGEGYFDSTGKRLIFQSEREPGNPFYQIYILDLTTGESHRVSPGMGKTTCSFFSSAANKVLFASTHLDPESENLQKEEIEFRASGKQRRYSWDYDTHFDIFEAGEDGSDVRRLTDAVGYDAEGSYSPDGTKIAFCSNRSAYPVSELSAEEKKLAELDPSYFGEIYIMNADGSGQTRLTRTPGYDGGPFFTPDGERIVWRRFTRDGLNADVYTMRLDGTDVRRLTDFGSMSWAPYFHPSGDYCIFGTNKLGFSNFELFIVDAMGKKEPVRVTFAEGFDGLAVFSPGGDQLAWTSTRHNPSGGRAGGQLFIGAWNDAAAREALEQAPVRTANAIESKAAAERPEQTHQFNSAIAEADLRAHVEYLASDELAGRLTGTEGERMAAEYIADRFREIGLKTFGDDGFLSGFDFTAAVHPGPDNALRHWNVQGNPHATAADLAKEAGEPTAFIAEKDFLPLTLSGEETVMGTVAFAGYGLVVPDDDGAAIYDSYTDLDVEGKIVLILRYVPEDVSPETRQVYNRFAGLRYKALQARERGAVGMLVVTGPNSPNTGALVGMNMDFGGASSGIAAASISLETAEWLLSSSDKKLGELQSELDDGTEIAGFDLWDSVVELSADLEKETRSGKNVIGFLPPEGGVRADTEYLVIGAHYDHLGMGSGGNSLAGKGEEGEIHPGADDNASGVATLLEVAAEMASSDEGRRRGIIFAAWSGEELGTLGSSSFCAEPPVELTSIIANLNMDMVGRVVNNKLAVQGVGSSGDWRSLIERKNVVAGFSLGLTEDPYLPTDSQVFYLRKIPGLHFFSGSHEDYHRPTDTADRINYPDLARVSQFVGAIASELTEKPMRPEYAEVQRSGGGGNREAMRAYLGTIPEYAGEETVGVKLAGVQSGGPADKGGLKSGDVIVEFAGQKITNIYDYTYALDAVKIGQAVEIVVMREGKRVKVSVTPESR